MGMYPGEHAKDHPDQPALIMATSGEQLTFAEYEANCNRLAHLFRAAGLRRGDHVAMFLENHLRYFELQGAAERTGLYFTCINSYLTPEEVAYIVDDCEARVFFTSVAKADVAVEAAAMTPARRGVPVRRRRPRRSGRSSPTTTAIAAFPAGADRRRAARRGDAVLVGHDGPPEGDPAPAARGASRASRWP